jgi:hypothetical protein
MARNLPAWDRRLSVHNFRNNGYGGRFGANEEFVCEPRVAEVNAVPEMGGIQGNAAPPSTDLSPCKGRFGSLGPIEPRYADCEYQLKDFGR